MAREVAGPRVLPMLVKLVMVFVHGRGDQYAGHPDLPTELCTHWYDADRLDVSVQLDGGNEQFLGSVYESAEYGATSIKVPGTTLTIPFQRIEGEKEITLQVN